MLKFEIKSVAKRLINQTVVPREVFLTTYVATDVSLPPLLSSICRHVEIGSLEGTSTYCNFISPLY